MKPLHKDASVLSGRQMDIIKYLSKGLTEVEIASELKISVSNVKYHKSRIYITLGVKCAAEAIARCMEQGILNNREFT